MSFWMFTIAEEESDMFAPHGFVDEVSDGKDLEQDGKFWATKWIIILLKLDITRRLEPLILQYTVLNSVISKRGI